MVNNKEAKRVPRKQTSADNVGTLLKLLGKLRRRASRLDSLGMLPGEVSVRVFGHILGMEEDLKWLNQEKS